MIITLMAGVPLVTGTLLIAITGVALIRLPDVYNRMNAVAKASSLGLILVLLGVLILRPSPRTVLVVTVAIGLQLITAPIGAYALANAAYRAGTPLASLTCHDALAGWSRGPDGPAAARPDGAGCGPAGPAARPDGAAGCGPAATRDGAAGPGSTAPWPMGRAGGGAPPE